LDRQEIQPPLSVALLALPETTPGALYGLYEMLLAVGTSWQLVTGESHPARQFQPQIVARDGKPFSAALNLSITPNAALKDIPQPDIVIITDLELTPAMAGFEAGEEAAWLKACHDGGATLCSVCTGAVLLAEAGLLDGLEATTHWSTTTLMRDRYPAVALRPERILCPAGLEHRIVTAGGSASWMDLALYLIARFSGAPEARRIARLFLAGDRTEGQLPFAALVRPRQHDDAVIGACQAWIAAHYEVAGPVSAMIERAGLNERTFTRRFRAATGYTPLDYVQALRVEEAKQMLETTSDSTDAIARAVGYEDVAFFRRLFRRLVGVSPARYRQRVQGTGSTSGQAG